MEVHDSHVDVQIKSSLRRTQSVSFSLLPLGVNAVVPGFLWSSSFTSCSSIVWCSDLILVWTASPTMPCFFPPLAPLPHHPATQRMKVEQSGLLEITTVESTELVVLRFAVSHWRTMLEPEKAPAPLPTEAFQVHVFISLKRDITHVRQETHEWIGAVREEKLKSKALERQ